MRKTTNLVEVTEAQVKAMLENTETSKSSKIKGLFDAGFEVKDIAALLGIRYNFAYNVIQNYAIINGIDVEASKKDTKKTAVFACFDKGMSIMETAKELKMAYNSVWKNHKEWEAEVIKEAEKEVK